MTTDVCSDMHNDTEKMCLSLQNGTCGGDDVKGGEIEKRRSVENKGILGVGAVWGNCSNSHFFVF